MQHAFVIIFAFFVIIFADENHFFFLLHSFVCQSVPICWLVTGAQKRQKKSQKRQKKVETTIIQMTLQSKTAILPHPFHNVSVCKAVFFFA
jgi:hypothetical protein